MATDNCLGPLGYAMYFAALALPLIDGLAVFSENHRCLHDRLAGTIVVAAIPPTIREQD